MHVVALEYTSGQINSHFKLSSAVDLVYVEVCITVPYDVYTTVYL
jgi:hypothetical protein